jgi:hypothetical protein
MNEVTQLNALRSSQNLEYYHLDENQILLQIKDIS